MDLKLIEFAPAIAGAVAALLGVGLTLLAVKQANRDADAARKAVNTARSEIDEALRKAEDAIAASRDAADAEIARQKLETLLAASLEALKAKETGVNVEERTRGEAER